MRIANVALTNRNDAPRVFHWLQTTDPDGRPDIVTIQKTGPKATFPERALSEIGYETCCPGGPEHYLGVAVLSHRDLPPPETVDCGLPNATEGESRFLTVSIGSLWVSSVYVPYKVYVPYEPEGLRRPDVICRRVRWLNHLREHILDKGYDRRDTVLCGDFNVKFKADGPRKGPYGQDDEDALQAILNLGFVDLYRDTHPDPKKRPGRTHGYRRKFDGTSRLHLMLASRSVARCRRNWLDRDASSWPTKDGPPLVVDLDGLKV